MAEIPNTETVSKAELTTLRAIKSLMDKAWDSKDTGASLRQLLKKVQPDLKIPEDVADSVIKPVVERVDAAQTQVTEFGKRLDKFLAETKDKEDTASLRSDLAAAQKKFGLDDEGLTKVMQRMKDKSNPDVEAAAAWVAASAPKPKPLSNEGFMPTNADLFGTTTPDDRYKALQTGGDPFRPGGWFDQEATKIMNEPVEQAA